MLVKEVLAAVVPLGDVEFVEAVWDFFFAAHKSMLQCAVYVASASSACGFGVLRSVSAVNNSQLAFGKMHLLTGLPSIG